MPGINMLGSQRGTVSPKKLPKSSTRKGQSFKMRVKIIEYRWGTKMS